MTWPKVRGLTAVERDAASRERQRLHLVARPKTQPVKPVTPTTSWWTVPPEQFYERSHKEAERMNAVTICYLGDLEHS